MGARPGAPEGMSGRARAYPVGMAPHGSQPPPPGGFGYPPAQGQVPVAPFQQPGYVARPPPPSALSILRKVRLILILVFGVPCLILVVAVIVNMELAERRDYVLFDNVASGPLTVFVDDKPVATLAGKSERSHSKLVELAEGRHAVRVEGDGKAVDQLSIDVPARGRFDKGMRAVAPVGGRMRYAMVSAVYVAPGEKVDEKETFEPLTPEQDGRVVKMPTTVARIYFDDVDKSFSRTESIPKGSKFVRITHVCRITKSSSGGWRSGCPGSPSFED